MWTEESVRQKIASDLENAGSFRRLAEEVGFSAAYLHDIVERKRGISEEIAKKFGFERIEKKTVIFRRIK